MKPRTGFDELMTGRRVVSLADRRRAAAIIRSAFDWQNAAFGRCYSWWTVRFRRHWMSSSATVVVGLRRPSLTVRLRARAVGVRLPRRAFMVFDLAGTRKREHALDVVHFCRVLLRAAGHDTSPIVARVQRSHHRLLHAYARCGLVPMTGDTSPQFSWLVREVPTGDEW